MGFLPLVWQLWVIFLAFIPAGWASTAECVSGWEWSDNSKNQNPCEVAGYLQGACLGHGTYELGPLAPNSWYTEPAKGDTIGLRCGCNTVIYSLHAACTACQNISTEVWSKWSQNCDALYVTQYPLSIPGRTVIPRWAFLNVTKTGNFDAAAAKNVGRDPEILENVPTAIYLSSTSLGKSSTPSTPIPTPGSSSGAFGPLLTGGGTSGQNSNLAPIIGGVVAGVVGFVILSLLLWSSLRHCSSEAPLFAARRPFSHRTFSTHSESYALPSESVDKPPLEVNENGNQSLAVYNRLNPGAPQESMYSPRSIVSSPESDLQTTRFSTPCEDGRRYVEHTESQEKTHRRL